MKPKIATRTKLKPISTAITCTTERPGASAGSVTVTRPSPASAGGNASRHCLGNRDAAREEEDRCDCMLQPLLRKSSGQARARERSGDGRRGADAEQRPVDAARQVPENARGPDEEADRHVRADCERERLAEPNERRQPQRAEDQS